MPEHAILSSLWSTVHLLSEEPIASNGEATEAYLIRPPFGLFWIQGICGFDCTNQTAWQKTWLWVDSISWIVCFFFGGRPGECSLLGWCMDWHGGRWSWWCLDLRWAQFDWARYRFAQSSVWCYTLFNLHCNHLHDQSVSTWSCWWHSWRDTAVAACLELFCSKCFFTMRSKGFVKLGARPCLCTPGAQRSREGI